MVVLAYSGITWMCVKFVFKVLDVESSFFLRLHSKHLNTSFFSVVSFKLMYFWRYGPATPLGTICLRPPHPLPAFHQVKTHSSSLVCCCVSIQGLHPSKDPAFEDFEGESLGGTLLTASTIVKRDGLDFEAFPGCVTRCFTLMSFFPLCVQVLYVFLLSSSAEQYDQNGHTAQH